MGIAKLSRHEQTVFEACPLVRRFAATIAGASRSKPILDVGCGSGRNALALSELGCTVICIDRDLTLLEAHRLRLRNTPLKKASARLIPHQMDLSIDRWPFTRGSIGGIITVHFLLTALFPDFEISLSSGGYYLLQTVPGCGGNYLELPKAGALRHVLDKAFDVEFYRERRVGPPASGAVTVQALARKLR